MKRYLPVIEAANGREYTNIYYFTKEEAEKALSYFINVFKNNNDSKIIKAYIREVK